MMQKDCDAPRCDWCDSDEYQEMYTTESKCEQQPYCDPSKTFVQLTQICIFSH